MAVSLTVITFAGCSADKIHSKINVYSENITTFMASSEPVTTTSSPTSTSSKKAPPSSRKTTKPEKLPRRNVN